MGLKQNGLFGEQFPDNDPKFGVSGVAWCTKCEQKFDLSVIHAFLMKPDHESWSCPCGNTITRHDVFEHANLGKAIGHADARGAFKCPVCLSSPGIYRRNLNPNMALMLSRLYCLSRDNDRKWFRHGEFDHGDSREGHKLVHWGLTVENKDERGVGSGDWAITDIGINFVLGRSTIQDHILLLPNDIFMKVDGAFVTIFDILAGNRPLFDAILAKYWKSVRPGEDVQPTLFDD